jgi:hypothetical protein
MVEMLAKITASYRKRNRNIGSTVRVNDNRCFGVLNEGRFYNSTWWEKEDRVCDSAERWKQRGLITKRPTIVFFFRVPRNLSHHMDRQARTGDTVLVKSREMTGRTQTLPWWLGGGGVKTTDNKIHWPCWKEGRIFKVQEEAKWRQRRWKS